MIQNAVKYQYHVSANSTIFFLILLFKSFNSFLWLQIHRLFWIGKCSLPSTLHFSLSGDYLSTWMGLWYLTSYKPIPSVSLPSSHLDPEGLHFLGTIVSLSEGQYTFNYQPPDTVFKLLLRPLFLLLLVPISSLKIFKPYYSQQDQINLPQLPSQKEPVKASKSSLAGTKKNLQNGALLPALFSSSCSKLLGWFFSHCAPSTSPSFY